MSFVSLLGEKVTGKSGEEVEVSSLGGEGKVVGIYFSAHWCPPCRAFTPQLAEWYKRFKGGPNGSNFEMVFISSDRDERSFKEYFDEMPWLALPYSERERKNKLSKKFKVTGIPTLVFLDGDAKVLTKNARSLVMEDPDGKDFPWRPKVFTDLIPGNLVNKEGNTKSWDDIEADVIGLYFSAHWCGPCRGFTPQLVKAYNKIKEEGKSFEMIFASSDRDEESFKSYLNEMPWWAFPFQDPRKKAFSQLFDVQGIPTLIILKRDGEVITTNGRGAVSSDPEGKEFPWYPKPVETLTGSTAGDINDSAAIIWFADNSDKAKETLLPIAKEYISKFKGGKVEEEVKFFVYNKDDDDDDIGDSLKSFAKIQESVKLCLINVPEQGVYKHEGEVTKESVEKILEDFANSTLKITPISH